jgi:hypothetical protein
MILRRTRGMQPRRYRQQQYADGDHQRKLRAAD